VVCATLLPYFSSVSKIGEKITGAMVRHGERIDDKYAKYGKVLLSE
jgi:hypothetical protein